MPKPYSQDLRDRVIDLRSHPYPLQTARMAGLGRTLPFPLQSIEDRAIEDLDGRPRRKNALMVEITTNPLSQHRELQRVETFRPLSPESLPFALILTRSGKMGHC